VKIVRGLAYPDADEFMVGQTRSDGTYQIDHLMAALRHVTDFTCAIDGGAHIGTWSKVMSERFERVIAVEPSRDTFEALDWNLTLAVATNVEPRNIALGNAPGFVEMRLNDEQTKRANTGARFTTPDGSIPVETIDSWNLPSLGFLKMDIEGSEFVALQGAVETLKRCRPIVLFEQKWMWVKNFGLPKDAVSDLLKRCGYRFLEQAGADAIWGPK
jgi:FkbM family methyltransferase